MKFIKLKFHNLLQYVRGFINKTRNANNEIRTTVQMCHARVSVGLVGSEPRQTANFRQACENVWSQIHVWRKHKYCTFKSPNVFETNGGTVIKLSARRCVNAGFFFYVLRSLNSKNVNVYITKTLYSNSETFVFSPGVRGVRVIARMNEYKKIAKD